ncbi:MAG: PucR family transcriptional regulator ligand-binding domain-containing protein [Candidatus Dormiibacterota bacterium]
MRVHQALGLPVLGEATLVAGCDGVDREVRWANVVDIPDPLPWVSAGQLLLTTGFAWPSAADEQRRLVRDLVGRGLAGVALAVPKYLDHFPEAAKKEADRAHLPLVEVPWEIPFATVTQAVNGAILTEQYQVIEQSIQIHRELTRAAVTAGSLQDLLDTLGRLIDREVTLEDAEGRVLAAWPGTQGADPVRRATLEKGWAPAEVTAHLDRLGHLGRIKTSPVPVRIPADPEINLLGRVVCPIWLRDELVGTVWIVEGDDELSDLHLRAAEHAAVVAALHIANQRQLASLEVRLGSTFLDSLLEGKFDVTAHNLERARLMGFLPEAPYKVGILVFQSELPLTRDGVLRRDRATEHLRHRLSRAGGIPLTSARLNQVAFLLAEQTAAETVWDPGWSASSVGLVLGRAHPGADGVRRSYLEALSIVTHVVPGEVRLYEDMLLLRVLNGDQTARQDFLEQLLGPAQRAKGGATLVASLLTLAEVGFHRRRAAAALHVHPNTLRYRLERAGDLLQMDFGDPDVRFRLQLAVNLMSVPHNPSR